MTIQEKAIALQGKNITIPFGTSETAINEMYAKEFEQLETVSTIYALFKAGKLTTSGNQRSLLSAKTLAMFGVKTPSELFTLLRGKKITVTLKSISEVLGKNLSARVLNGNDKSTTIGVKYVLECAVNVGATSDRAINFEIENKGSLVSQFHAQLIEKTKGVIGEKMETKVVMYDIDGNVTIGLYDFSQTPTIGEC